ncbi:hypothetical protein I633_09460 [Alteromonas mediterranea 615]|uniref:HTH crp-type domain-containing protein n=1 Tax=Alteromonas mediterranea 615 TaxID=1300253 RepID=S5ACD1_9ALTE|nr:hypothetical protein I633_09460 [Alteromonas mediterranea 615]
MRTKQENTLRLLNFLTFPTLEDPRWDYAVPPYSRRTIARYLGLPYQTVIRILKDLERQGQVIREVRPTEYRTWDPHIREEVFKVRKMSCYWNAETFEEDQRKRQEWDLEDTKKENNE